MFMDSSYNPQEIENKWYSFWESSGFFKPSFKEGAPNYCIQLPPPNVTGTLHMGHGFQHTIQDLLIRYHRMKGFNTLWQPGLDHAGIATQLVVERQLEEKGLTKEDLGREKFIDEVWTWKEESGGTITTQMKRLGSSCDWSRERFTMDKGLSEIVTQVFVELYNKGYIYRGKRLVNWDIKLQTAVSDLEVINKEKEGFLWHILYCFADNPNPHEGLTVATTRPETMLGDGAIAVNPEDERYKHLIGKYVIVPLVNRKIPIVADEYVDPAFGTGCVKITGAHDFNDYQIAIKHDIELIQVINEKGIINDNAPLKYRGLERFVARETIVKDLEQDGHLIKVVPHTNMVPHGDRSDTVIEPMLTSQWFMNMHDFAKLALKLVADGEIKFVPNNWQVIYNQWLENIQDWCISRQLWWGHRIPAYYDKEGRVYVVSNLEEAARLANTTELTQDSDVLDTWFSSSLWCFSTLGWPQDTQELKAFLPSQVLVTGFDIIFFWVARMIMMTKEFTDKIPFQAVYITGLIQDAHGNKMSKSKGNIIDPLDLINGITLEELIEKRTKHLLNPKLKDTIANLTRKDYPQGFQAFGADALRFTFASLATHGREIRFDLTKLEAARNFCNKIWNAAKFVISNVSKYKDNILLSPMTSSNIVDRWILLELNNFIKDVDIAYDTYRFDIAAHKMYEFVWNEFCDWYLELAKVNLQSNDEQVRISTVNTLFYTLDNILKILHPLMPFITEEIWQSLYTTCDINKNCSSIMISNYPSLSTINPLDELEFKSSVMQNISSLKQLIGLIRNLRAEMNLSPSVKVPLFLQFLPNFNENDLPFNSLTEYIKSLAKVTHVEIVESLDESRLAPIVIFNNMRLMLDIKVDKAAEEARLKKELEKLQKDIDKLKVKLDNPSYISRAPQELVKADQTRLDNLVQVFSELTLKLDNLTSS